MKKIYLLAALPLLLIGCAHNADNLKKSEDQVAAVDLKIQEDARKYVAATGDALAAVKPEQKTPETELASAMNKRAADLLGAPKFGTRISVKDLLSENQKIREKAVSLLSEQDRRVAQLIEERNRLQEQSNQYRDKLLELGRQKEQENNKNIVSKIWHWALGTLGIGGLIAAAVFCPFLIPIFGQILSYLISLVPQVMSFFGVVGKSVATNLVKGIGEVRNNIKSAPDDKTYTKEEIRALLDNELKAALDHSDKTVIQHLRDQLKL